MELYDIVYILKNDVKPDELRYSLRSLKNFPHARVWFAGGIPEGLRADGVMPIEQEGISKYQKAGSTYRPICENDQISDQFWLFNDDFFIMQPITEYGCVYDETLFEKIIRIEDKHNGMTAYTKRLRNAAKWLRENGYDVLNYENHMPMLYDKKKLLRVLDIKETLDSECYPTRSLYGNIYETGEVNHKDVKIIDTGVMPDPECDFLSTSDLSFRRGKVGEYIRDQFKDPCEYEVKL